MSAPIVFFDLAGPNDVELITFYSEIFDWKIAPGGGLSTPVVSPTDTPPILMGTIRKDPAEKLSYIGVEDITATLNAIVERGGSVEQPRFEVPGIAVLGLFKDPPGNRVGLVEMDNDKAKVP